MDPDAGSFGLKTSSPPGQGGSPLRSLSNFIGYREPGPAYNKENIPKTFRGTPPSYRLLGSIPYSPSPQISSAPPLVCYPFCTPFLVLLVSCAPLALSPASPLLRLALTRGVCVSPLQCWVVLCISGSRWRLSLPGLRFFPPDLGGLIFSTRPWWFFLGFELPVPVIGDW